jgi:hypothetical protein
MQNSETFLDIEGQLSEDEVEDMHLRDEVARLWQEDREDKIQARARAMTKLWRIQESGVKAATREAYLAEVMFKKMLLFVLSVILQTRIPLSGLNWHTF